MLNTVSLAWQVPTFSELFEGDYGQYYIAWRIFEDGPFEKTSLSPNQTDIKRKDRIVETRVESENPVASAQEVLIVPLGSSGIANTSHVINFVKLSWCYSNFKLTAGTVSVRAITQGRAASKAESKTIQYRYTFARAAAKLNVR